MISKPCILNDVTRCIGCDECVAACKKLHGLQLEDPAPRIGQSADGLSANRWTSILRQENGANIRRQCRHCIDPACVSACPVGALQKTAEGPVIWDNARCIGCRYCMMSCPYGIPRFTWSLAIPSIRKCTMCYEKIKAGEVDKPACVSACPKEATTYGSRDEMLAEARRRLAAEPDKYIQHIWGEHEVGGTNVLYISHVDLAALGWTDPRTLSGVKLPDTTWEVLKQVPYEFMGMGTLMAGIWWVIDRRMRLQQEELEESPSESADSQGDEQ